MGNIVGKAQKTTNAFTIVELLIVIVVIGILTGIVMVGYRLVVNNANDRSVQADISKLADSAKLLTLDNNGVPDGGVTSSGSGDPTVLSGITFQPNNSSYDLTVANLYFCSGTINGTKEFSVIARAKSGNAFVYSSKNGVTSFSGYTWTSVANGVTVCGLAGYTAPFTWSYGYNPAANYGWYAWANSGNNLTNLVTNPSMETNVTGWANYTGLAAPTRVTTTPWVGTARLSAVGLGTSTSPRVYTDIPANPGDVFSVTFRVRSDGQAATGGTLVVKNTNGGTEVSTFYSNTVSWTPDGNGWVNTTGTFTVPSGGTAIRLSIGLTSAANYSGTMGIDGVMVVRNSTIPTYADGNTSRWSWTGAVNNSTSTGPKL